MLVFQMSPKLKRNIYRILPFGLLWGVFAVIYILIEQGLLGDLDYYPSTGNSYDFGRSIFFTTIGSILMGLVFGTAEILFLNRFFTNRSFGAKIIIKTCVYLISILTFLFTLTFIINSSSLNLPIFDPAVVESVFAFFYNFAFWSIVIYMGVIINITLFIAEVSDNLGQGILKNFLTGRYHQPREEIRIFMFLDMKGSTTIAEKLGHIEYYKLLNMYYADITEAVVQTSGQIYQYVGDEVVVSWQLKRGLENNNCLRCFFLIKEIFQGVSKKYTSEFGMVPGFKAGLHYGEVTIGEIGVVKKEIIFTGDVLNTTARIQSSCNKYNVDILISDVLLNQLKTEDEYILTEIGECRLRGKDEKVLLQTVKLQAN